MLSEMGSKALVEALRDVIKDFNSRLNEQFGDNFKHLNEGVEKLLIWQEQHKSHVELMSDRLEEITKMAGSTTSNQKTMVEQALIFSTIAKDLASLLTGLETQKVQISDYAKALGQLLNSASATIPSLERHIEATVNSMSLAASKTQETLTKAIEESAAGMKRTLESAAQASMKANEEHGKQISQLVTRSKEQIDLLDAALADELKKSLEALGGQLAALSEKLSPTIARLPTSSGN